LYLKVSGENETETKVLDSLNYRRIYQNLNKLNTSILDIQATLHNIGYIENTVQSTLKINDSTYHSIFSLKRRFDTIYIYYNKNDISKAILETVVNDVTDTYFKTTIYKSESILENLNSKIIEKGQPFASIHLVDLKIKSEDALEARLKINLKGERQIDDIVVKGYEQFPKSFLKHFLKLKKGSSFDLEKIKEKTEALNALPFANQTRSPEVLFTKDSTNLYVYLEKTKSNTFDGFLGFGTNEKTNKIEFDGYLDLRLINNLNFGEEFNLSYKSDEIEQKTFNVNLSLPYFFGTALGTEVDLNIFKKDSTFTTVNQAANLFYQINRTQKIFLGINGMQSTNLLSEASLSNVEDLNSFFYTLQYQIVKLQPNNLLFPINLSLRTKFGLGTRTHDSDKESQQNYNIEVFKIFNLNSKNSLFINAISQGIFSDSYFTNEMLRFGGINSIRGFEENSLIATLFGLVQTEYRFKLNSNIYVHSIFDASYLENQLLDLKQKLFGFGFGFGIITKAGLLKFNYANGKFEDQKFQLSNSKIHLSLNATF